MFDLIFDKFRLWGLSTICGCKSLFLAKLLCPIYLFVCFFIFVLVCFVPHVYCGVSTFKLQL